MADNTTVHFDSENASTAIKYEKIALNVDRSRRGQKRHQNVARYTTMARKANHNLAPLSPKK